MTLNFFDSFDHYAYTDLSLKYSSVAGSDWRITSAGRNGTNALYNSGGGNANFCYLTKNFSANATWIIGFAVRVNTSFATQPAFAMQLFDGSSVQCGLYSLSTGALVFRRGDYNGTIVATSASTMSLNTYYFVELKATIGASGTIEVRVNGTSVGWIPSQTANIQSTANAYVDRIQLQVAGGQGVMPIYIDDLYICDGAGTTNNDFLGDCRIVALFPDGAGSNTQFSPSTGGANYTCVDETTPNSDTDYVATSGTGYIDTYTYQDLTTTSGTILGVQVNIFARKDDAGSRTIAGEVRTGGVNYSGPVGFSIGDSYTYYKTLFELNPATNEKFTISEINNAEFGVILET
jgi:hypothetical protein